MTLILSGTDGLSDVDGSAATPAIRGTDANTGIFFPAADTVGVSTGGSERVRVNSSGNVGIGTSSVATTLDVRGANKTVSDQYGVTNIYSTDTFAINKGGSLSFGGKYATDGSVQTFGAIAGRKEDAGDGGWAGYIQFATGAPTLTERMRIDSSGNVGIGTSSPAVKLDVNGITGWSGATTGQTAQIVGASSGIGGGGNFRVLSNTTQAVDVGGVLTLGGYYTTTTASVDFASILGAKENSTGGNTAGYLAFGTRPNAGNMTERMRIDSSGNLRFNSGYGSVATAYGCRAWVNFNGTGTVAIRASGNVTSITDGGVGIYRVNFTTSMPDVNFATNASVAGGGTVNSSTCAFLVNATSAAAAGQTSNVAYVDIFCYHPGNQVAQDNALCSVSVFR